MSSTMGTLNRLIVTLPLPSNNSVMDSYGEFCQVIGIPPLALIAEYLMTANQYLIPFTKDLSYEWIDNRITEALYQAVEEESIEQSFSLIPGDFKRMQASTLLANLENDPSALNRHYNFVDGLNDLFHLEFSQIPFPDNLTDYGPVMNFDFNKLNSNTALLEITDDNDIEQFRELYAIS